MLPEKKQLRVVFPGDIVGVAEEFIAGDGLEEKDGVIYAVRPGLLEINMYTRTARVAFHKPINIPKKGDKVLARVLSVEKNLIHVKVFAMESKKGLLPLDLNGYLVPPPGKRLRKEDIVRAKVVSSSTPLILEFGEPDLGIVFAICPNCLSELVIRGTRLVCSNCGYAERRKIAKNSWFKRVKRG